MSYLGKFQFKKHTNYRLKHLPTHTNIESALTVAASCLKMVDAVADKTLGFFKFRQRPIVPESFRHSNQTGRESLPVLIKHYPKIFLGS